MLTGELANILRDLVIPQPVLEWLRDYNSLDQKQGLVVDHCDLE